MFKAIALSSGVMFLVGIGMASAQTTAYSSCRNFYARDTPTPGGYGAAWDMVFGGVDISVDCNADVVIVGTGYQLQYIYKLAYLYQNKGWQPLNLSGEEGGSLIAKYWYLGQATGNLGSVDLTEIAYIVGFVCDWNGSGWKCGCADQTCSAPGWQLQAVRGVKSQRPAQGITMVTITGNGTITVKVGSTLVFPRAQPEYNGVIDLQSDNESVVHITNASNAVALVPGTAHLYVMMGPYCPSGAPCLPTGIKFYTVTANVEY
jgi:hypothetical protein